MNNKSGSPFDFSGFAAETDLVREDWRVLFKDLERKQTDFLKYETEFRSDSYKWPRDPLHTWSRLWEYPYVYHNVLKIQEQSANKTLHILDFGSGVTFFPFAIAQLGCNVSCADIDPICAVDIPRAAMKIQHLQGAVTVALIENGRIPVPSESQDIVYCVSVIEHISNFEAVLDEMARVMKQGGHLILTVDIDLRGNLELGVDEFERLLIKLDERFIKNLPERPVHPRNLLTTTNSPHRIKNESLPSSIKRLAKSVLEIKLLNGDPRVGMFLGVYATVLAKK